MSVDLPTLLAFAKKAGASDLHLSAGAQPMVRISGDMRPLEVKEVDLADKERIRRLIYGFLTELQKKRLENDLELDCAITLGEGERFRANIFVQDRGLGAVLRVIPNKIRTVDELGLPPVIRDLADLEKGLVLVTGPTGSGKSTTLAAIIDLINRTRKGHILTIEDPIEFVHKQKKCMINQREVGPNTKSFKNALRSALREDPDVILVGEMRDHETIALALTAAETGHLVFGTLHTSSAAKTVDRIINVFPSTEQAQIREIFATSIQAIIAQVLLKKRGGGRVAAHEILLGTDAARAMIREGKNFQLPSVIQTSGRVGMQTLEQCLERLISQGVVDADEATDVIEKLTGAWVENDRPRSGTRPEDERRERERERERDREKERERDRKGGSDGPRGVDPRGGESSPASKPPTKGEPVVVIGASRARPPAPSPPPAGGHGLAQSGATRPEPFTLPGATPPRPEPPAAPGGLVTFDGQAMRGQPGTASPPPGYAQQSSAPPPPPPPPPPTKRHVKRAEGAVPPTAVTGGIDVEAFMARVKEQKRREGEE